MGNGACKVRVVNWDRYQHYKHRDPPWIKMHNSLLEDPVMAALPDTAKAHLFGLWLLASRLDNKIPADSDFIGKRINATSPVDLKLFIKCGFLEWTCSCSQHASNPLATCSTTFQVGSSEKSREETEERRVDPGAVAPAKAPDWNREAAEDYREAYRADPPKAYFGHVKPVAKKYGWSRTRPALRAYMLETAIEHLNIAKVLPVRIEGGHSLTTASALARPPTDKAKQRLEGMNAFIRGGLKRDGNGVDRGHEGASHAALPGPGADNSGVPGQDVSQVPRLPDGPAVAARGRRDDAT